MPSGSRSLRAAALGFAFLLIAVLATDRATAQQREPAAAAAAPSEGAGRIAGRVVDRDTGAPVEGATVVLNHPQPVSGGEPQQELASTDADGQFVFGAVPAGRYRLEVTK